MTLSDQDLQSHQPSHAIKGHVHHIPHGRPFAEDLVRGVMAMTNGPEDLADSIILLPNRRLSRAVRDAFLRMSEGGAQLLPRMLSIGDVDEDSSELVVAGWDVDDLPQVIDPLERQLYLSRLITEFINAGGASSSEEAKLSLGEVMSLARALAEFLDQVETAGCDLNKLDDLVQGEHAQHWSKILTFLKIVTETWPQILQEINRSDPVVWRNAAIRARARAWQASPPKGLVVVAGSTGSVPATQDLMKAVMTLDRGHLVLPGLDTGMENAAWDDLGDPEDETFVAHPQYPLRQLLDALDFSRSEVTVWQGTYEDSGYNAEASGRINLLCEVMRPARQTDQWRRIPERQMVKPDSVDGLHLVECYDRRQEAEVIGLAMREALEVPEKTAALVTADLKLAEAVSDVLRRWGIAVAPSAGKRLIDTPPAQFMRLILEAWIEDFSALSLLAMARHQLAAAGMEKSAFRQQIRALELKLLRGPQIRTGRHQNGFAALYEEAKTKDDELAAFIKTRLLTPLEPLLALDRNAQTDLATIADIHGQVTEAMSATPEDSLAPWQGQDGYRLGQFLHKISLYGGAIRLDPEAYQSALMVLMSGEIIYPDDVSHPRLAILGTVEARMHTADLIILGGLNEGISPAAPPADPWMSQKMRIDLGLPHAHWRVGHAAHDAVMAMARPHVLMTRAERDDGSPQSPSRWLQRLDAVMKVTGITLPSRPDLLAYTKMMNAYDGEVKPIARPDPKPPLDVRPRQFSATRLDTLLHDPYAIYAEEILKLKALPDLAEALGASDRGTLIHKVFCTFIETYPKGSLPEDALDQLIEMGRLAFKDYDHDLSVMTFWWQRFTHMAAWFVTNEESWRKDLKMSYAEIRGETTIPTAMGDIKVTAKADRIDITNDGRVRIVDYKTGAAPAKKNVQEGRALQLRVEALLVGENGYPDIGQDDLAEDDIIEKLEYWKLSGKRGEPGKSAPVMPKDEDVIARSRDGITELLQRFADPDQGYRSEPLAKEANPYSDYKYLARVREWLVQDDDGEGWSG